MSHAIDRLNAAAKASGNKHFIAGFIGALSVNFDPESRLDKTAWDRAIRIATETGERLERRAP